MTRTASAIYERARARVSKYGFVLIPSRCIFIDRDIPSVSLFDFWTWGNRFIGELIFQRPVADDLQGSTDSGDRRLISEFILHHDPDVAAPGSDSGKKESEKEEAGESKTIPHTHWAAMGGIALRGTTEGKESHKEKEKLGAVCAIAFLGA